MDNITHSLIACGAARVMEPAFHGRLTTRQRTALYLSSIIANNIPDGDFVLALLSSDAKMGSLLHHRGYTHTLVAVPVLGLFSAVLAMALCGAWQNRPAEGRGSRAPFLACGLAGVLGILLHVIADSWNEYGVHPFSPFWNRWFYGDTLFIVEPLLWLALAWAIPQGTGRKGALLTTARRGLIVLSLGLLCFFPGLQWQVAAGSLLWAGVLWLWARYLKKPLLLWLPTALLILIFSASSHQAKNFVARNVAAQAPLSAPQVSGLSRVTDIMVSPSPGNPFCWRAFAQLEEPVAEGGPRLSSHMGFVSLWPQVFVAATCHVRRPTEASASGGDPALASDTNVHWVRTSHASLDDIQALAQESCRFREFLSFARYPFLQKERGGRWIYGDLRYDFNASAGFAEFTDAPETRGVCLRIPAPWLTPLLRQDVIQN